MCVHGPQSIRLDTEKVSFYDEVASEWDLGSCSEITFLWGISMGMWEMCAEGFEGVHGAIVLRKKMLKEENCWSSL